MLLLRLALALAVLPGAIAFAPCPKINAYAPSYLRLRGGAMPPPVARWRRHVPFLSAAPHEEKSQPPSANARHEDALPLQATALIFVLGRTCHFVSNLPRPPSMSAARVRSRWRMR